jgi:hypothetical protein
LALCILLIANFCLFLLNAVVFFILIIFMLVLFVELVVLIVFYIVGMLLDLGLDYCNEDGFDILVFIYNNLIGLDIG